MSTTEPTPVPDPDTEPPIDEPAPEGDDSTLAPEEGADE